VGNWTLTLTVTSALGAVSATTVKSTMVIHVTAPNQPPTANLVVTPGAGYAPLVVTADGSGSVDPEGGRIASYRFDFGDGTVIGPQPGATATHTYATGNWTVSLTVKDSLGAAGSATAAIAVAPDNQGSNLAVNGSFETDSSGWAPVDGATLQRAAGGFDGSHALLVSGPPDTTSFGVTDSLDFVQSTLAAGTRYQFTAWVRSPSSHGAVRLRVRETYNEETQPPALSAPVTLSPSWAFVTLEYDALYAGSSLDLQILDQPAAAAETLLVDAVTITIIPTAPVAGVPNPSTVGFAPRLSPNPLRTDAQLAFELERPTPVRVRVFDLSGRLVRTLSSGGSTGRNVMILDGRADNGAPLRSGVYLYEVRAGSHRAAGRFVVMR
jgi:PKD repeat protein